ncbi:MAG: NAD-dependent epimerase/dehydratase family protein [Planctomycetes bacterium]|nr:NAD-dependent epimerase/dehydratase family protein [Planctomycetota bacterium]
MQPHVLITGGSGFIGRNVTRCLLQHGIRVRILDTTEPPSDLASEVEWVQGCILLQKPLQAALDGCTDVIHLAAELGIGRSQAEPLRFFEVNVQGTVHLLDTLQKTHHRVRRVVLAGSMTVYGEGRYVCPGCGEAGPVQRRPDRLVQKQWEPCCTRCERDLVSRPTPETFPAQAANIYAHTKLSQEGILHLLAEQAGIEPVVLRLFNVYGPGQSLENAYTGVIAIFTSCLLMEIAPLVFEDGNQRRDFVFVEDVSEAFYRAWATPGIGGRTFNIGSGEGHSLNEILGLLRGLTAGRASPRILYQYRKGDARHVVACTENSLSGLGWSPRTPLGEGLGRTVRSAREDIRTPLNLEKMMGELRRRGILLEQGASAAVSRSNA